MLKVTGAQRSCLDQNQAFPLNKYPMASPTTQTKPGVLN